MSWKGCYRQIFLPSTSASAAMIILSYLSLLISKSLPYPSPNPHPKALTKERISSLARTLSMDCFSTEIILPRNGKIAWNFRLRPVLALPPADFVFAGISVGTDYLFAQPCQGFNASNISQHVSIVPVLTNNGDSRYRIIFDTKYFQIH